MYGFVEPQFLVEERLPGSDFNSGPADIKIHCVDGIPKLIHVIQGRQTFQRQGFFNASGESLNLRIKPHRQRITDVKIEEILDLVRRPAELLSAPFRYVRVDLYIASGTVYFGELTFYEESGLFKNRGEERDLAEALEIDCSQPKPSIHGALGHRGQGDGAA
jgi:hypothetical protein